jgi:hypothetical protein
MRAGKETEVNNPRPDEMKRRQAAPFYEQRSGTS